MRDLCHDVFGVAKEKKDARDIKGNRGMSLLTFLTVTLLHGLLEDYLLHLILLRNFFLPSLAELLDVLPEKRKIEDGGYLSDDGLEVL